MLPHDVRFARSLLLLRALVGLGATLASGCASARIPEDPTEPSTRCVDQLHEGAPVPAGTRIVACDLAPGSVLVDVVDGVVFTMSPRGAFFRGEAASSQRTLLYRGLADASTPTYLDGRILFDGWSGTDAHRVMGMLAIDAHTVTPDHEAPVVSEAIGYAVGGRVLADGLVRYVSESGRQSVLELDVPSGRTRRVVNGTAIGLSPTWLYYCAVDGEVRRIRRDGTEDQALAASTIPAPHCGAELRAVDDEGIYLTRRDAPYEIWRFGPAGREDYIGTTWEGTGDLVIPPPARLFLHGSWVYVLHQGSGAGGLDALSRIAVDRGEQQLLGWVSGLGPPLFRDGHVYVAMTRDGLDGPVDGVVLEIDLDVASL